MSWYYFEPDTFGLEHVGAVDWLRGEGCYEWEETTVFFRAEDGLFYWDSGSGCSCDGPLEGVTKLDDLTSGNLSALSAELMRYFGSVSGYREDKDGVLALEVTRVIEAAVRKEGEARDN